MKVEQVEGAAGLEQVWQFHLKVYEDHQNWLPMDLERFLSLHDGRSPFCLNARHQAFSVRRGGEIRGVVTAVVDDGYNRHWQEKMGHLIFFEVLPHARAEARCLLAGACDFLRAQGMERVRASYLFGRTMPLVMDCYGALSTVFHTYNPAYYHAFLKDVGFVAAKGFCEFEVALDEAGNERFLNEVQIAEKLGVRLRPFNWDDATQETGLLTQIHNDAFADHWGASPFQAAELLEATLGLKPFLPDNFVQFAEVEGQVCGMVYCCPDLNQAFHVVKQNGIDPEQDPEGFGKAMSRIDRGILLMVAVQPGFRGHNVGRALAASAFATMYAQGYGRAAYSLVLDENLASRRMITGLGGYVAKNYLAYEMQL